MRHNSRRARLGPRWWDRNGHLGVRQPDGLIETWGVDEWGQVFVWPRPCGVCVEAFTG